MTDAMLSLFKGQLEAECSRIGEDNSLLQRGHQFIWWYFMRLHSFEPQDVEEVICDGAGDLGIDAIWIDDADLVHFYQFKNPVNPGDQVPAGEIDKLISGLHLVVDRQHASIANEALHDRVSDIYQMVPTGYRIHVVTSGAGITHESTLKLDSLVTSFGAKLFSWSAEGIDDLHLRFYTRNLPEVQDPILFHLDNPPHVVRSGLADCYFYTVPAKVLAQLYDKYGEGLLQRNIRVDQGSTPTNRSIEQACSDASAPNFVHYNNGVTFLCRSAEYDTFARNVKLLGSQAVNGGQTLRALHRAFNSVLKYSP